MRKFFSAFASASLVVSVFAPTVLAAADQELTIEGNGQNSDNTIVVTQTSNCTVKQKNITDVEVLAVVDANSGDNTANGTTGGNVDQTSGKATAELNVTVGGSSNTATDPCCGCTDAPTVDATIKNNGKNSDNDIVSTDTKNKTVKQKNDTFVGVGAIVTAKSGKNKANGTTGGSVTQKSKKAKAELNVTVAPSTNSL